MKGTFLPLTSARTALLLKLLSDVPPKKRDAIYNDLLKEVNKINDIWQNIDKQQKAAAEMRRSLTKDNKSLVNHIRPK